MLTIITSIVTALLSGALVAFLNSKLQHKRDSIKIHREKAEAIFDAMNRIVYKHNILGSNIDEIETQGDVENLIKRYSINSKDIFEILADDAVINTCVSIYFRDSIQSQQEVSAKSTEICYTTIDEIKSFSGLGIKEIADKKPIILASVKRRYDEFNDAAEILSKSILDKLESVEKTNSLI